MDSLKRADLVIDLMFLLFSKEQLEIQEAGARMLLCVEPVDNLARLFPTADQRRRVEASEELIAGAKSLRFTNEAGSDVVYRLGDYPVMTEYGVTDEPGRWDHWPSGFLFTAEPTTASTGKVVIGRGDIIVTPFKKFVEDPVHVTIEAGRIADIRGGLDAELLRDYIASFDEEKAYGISHIGWGCNEKARWSGLANDRRSIGMESRAFYGNTLFSTGPQHSSWAAITTRHVTSTSRCATARMYLDDEPIIIDSEFVIDDLKAARTGFRPPARVLTCGPEGSSERQPGSTGTSRLVRCASTTWSTAPALRLSSCCPASPARLSRGSSWPSRWPPTRG